MKELVGLVIVAVAVIASGFMVANAPTPEPVVNLGATPSPDIAQRLTTFSGLAEGGIFTISTTSATMTLKDADLANNKVVTVAAGANTVALALTLPASTTWPSLNKSGVAQSWVIDNQNTAAATTTTITAGTGVDIDGTTANDDVINGGVSGRLECWRLPNTDIRCIVEEMVDAG